MKTIQDYIRNVDKLQLAKGYLYEHPIDLMYIKDKDRTIAELLETAETNLVKYIERLQSIEIEEDEQVGILFVHKTIKDGFCEDAYSLVHLDELKRDGVDVVIYAYEFTEQSKIMGFFVSDAAYTQRNITDLMIDVMFEASFFGFEQEHLQEELDKLDQAYEEARQGKSIPAEEVFKQLEKELGIERSEPKIPDETEDELQHNVLQSMMDFDKYCLNKELTELIRIIEKE